MSDPSYLPFERLPESWKGPNHNDYPWAEVGRVQCKVGEALVGELEEGPNKEEKAAIIWLSKDSWPDKSEEGHQIEPIEGRGWITKYMLEWANEWLNAFYMPDHRDRIRQIVADAHSRLATNHSPNLPPSPSEDLSSSSGRAGQTSASVAANPLSTTKPYDSDAVDSYLTSSYTTEDDQALGVQSSDDTDCEREEETDYVDTSSIPLFKPE